MALDTLDTKIIALLQKDATAANAPIGRELGVSEETIRRRVKRLVQGDLIQIVAAVNPEKVGYNCQVVLSIRPAPSLMDDVAAALAEIEETVWVAQTTGDFSIFAHAILPSTEDLNHFLTTKVNGIPGVEYVQSSVVLQTKKRSHGISNIRNGK